MSQVETRVGQLKTTISLVGGNETAPPSANAKEGLTDTFTPDKTTSPPRKLIKEEDDDALTYLAILFGQNLLWCSNAIDDHEVRGEKSASCLDSEGASSESPALDDECTTPKAKANDLLPESSSNLLQEGNRTVALPISLITTNHEPTRELPPASQDENHLNESTLTSSEEKPEIAAIPSPSEEEATSPTSSDSHTEREESEPSTPKGGNSVLPRPAKEEEEDDPLRYLVALFGHTTLEDTWNTNGSIKPESVDEESSQPSVPRLRIGDEINEVEGESVPPTASPRSKAGDNYYYFYTLSGLYYFDDYRNVFFQDDTLVHDGSDTPDLDDLLTPHFCLDGVSFWFDDEGLLYQGIDGNLYHADVWKNEQELDQPGQSQTSDGLQASQDDLASLQPDFSHQSYLIPKDTLMAKFDLPVSYSTLLASPSIGGRSGGDGAFMSGGANCTNPTRGVKRKVIEDVPVQVAPAKAGSNDTHCFYASGRLYYFDSSRKLFSQDGQPLYNGSSSLMASKSPIPNFQIDEVAYWFEPDGGLSYRGLDGIRHPVHTWLSKQEPLEKCLSPEQRPISKNRRIAPPPMRKSCSPMVQPQPLDQSLLGVSSLAFSPGSSSSVSNTPNTPPTNPNQPTSDWPSLFQVSAPGHTQHIQVDPGFEDQIVQPEGPTEKAQPGKKQRGTKHLTCHICDKVCRRPVALEEHINAHLGLKPHKCPFDGCGTGFATRQNMRRHFLTHQVGEIEKYQPGMTQGSAPNKRRKAEVDTLPNTLQVGFSGRLRF